MRMRISFVNRKKKDETMMKEEQQISDESMEESSEKISEEENCKMPKAITKKKYVYLALDKSGVPVFDRYMQPIVSNITEEGEAIRWPDEVSKCSKKITSSKECREEVGELSPEELSGKNADKKAARKKLQRDAKERLLVSCAEMIEAAKRDKAGCNVDTSVNVQVENLNQDKQVASDGQMIKEIQKDPSSIGIEDNNKKCENLGDKNLVEEGEEKQHALDAKKVCNQINQDICDAVDDIIEIMETKDNELSAKIKCMQDQIRSCEGRTKKYIDESIAILAQKTQKVSEDVSRKVNDAGKSLSESQDKIISKVTAVGKKMGDFVESVEGIEGNLTRLDQLDEITDLLRNKGLNISMEIPPVNAEEEDIINLVRYSQKITEQLGYAARELIRKSESFKNQAESNENEQKIMTQRINKAHQEGVNEGKIQVVKQLLSKYEDIDAIKDSEESYIHVIWTMLTELGAVIDGDGFYQKGQEIELSDADIEKMMATYAKFDGAGKYRVTRTGVLLYGEIISVAQFTKVIDESNSDNIKSAEVMGIESKHDEEQKEEEDLVSVEE